MNETNVDAIKILRTALKSDDIKTFEDTIKKNSEHLRLKTVFGTWLHDAANLGKLDFVKFLVASGIDVNEKGGMLEGNSFNQAVAANENEIAEYLYSAGCKFDTDDSTCNPLFTAISSGNFEMAKFIISHGIDLALSYSGERMHNMDALAYAEERGELEIAELIRAELAKREKS